MNFQKNSLIFRGITEDDIDELHSLLESLSEYAKKVFHPHPFDLETLKNNCKSKNDHYFVMTLDNKIIGYAMLRLFGYEIPSFGCCIRTEFQGKGYGLLLTKWTVEKAKKLNYKKVILKTYKDNIPAMKIYKEAGFTIIGETEDKKQYKMEINL